MRFFRYDLIAAGNGWGDETVKQQKVASRRFDRAVTAYHRYLDRVHPDVPAAAWNFFRHGNPEHTLHDSRLVNMMVGDFPVRPLGWSKRGRGQFVTRVRLEFLTYVEDRLYTLDCYSVHRVDGHLWICPRDHTLGDAYTYELRQAENRHVVIEFLFETGATILLEFERLTFRVKRLAPKDCLVP